MQRISPADSPLLIFPDLDALARETRFVIRESSKMDPSTFLQTLCGAVASGSTAARPWKGCSRAIVETSST